MLGKGRWSVDEIIPHIFRILVMHQWGRRSRITCPGGFGSHR